MSVALMIYKNIYIDKYIYRNIYNYNTSMHFRKKPGRWPLKENKIFYKNIFI